VEVVLDGIPAGTNHNGGILGFAPDGTLFATTGDAGNSANSQDNGTLAGKVLRMDPDGSIPADNPIPGSPVYTLGHRNVFGLAFHPVTGTPYVSENGPGQDDEVNVLEPGRNYGWPNGTGPLQDPQYVDPILTFPSVIAPTGLAFYTGTAVPAWRDSLFLGDWNRGVVQRIALGGPTYRVVTGTEVVDSLGGSGVLDVEDGPDGFLYYSSPDAIYRVREPGGPPGPGPSGFGVALVLIAVAALVVGFAFAVWRERRRRRPPASPPPR
jgi:glucose/arabinose dehydrogenase